MARQTTSLSLTDEELVSLMLAVGREQDFAEERWDDARQDTHETADYWRGKCERLARLHRRLATARNRLAKKAVT